MLKLKTVNSLREAKQKLKKGGEFINTIVKKGIEKV